MALTNTKTVEGLVVAPESEEELTNDMKEDNREKRYSQYEQGLKEQLFEDLSKDTITYMIKGYEKKDYYKGCIRWDPDSLSEIAYNLGEDKDKFKKFFIDKKAPSYEEIEGFLSKDPNLLLSVLTLFTNNYSRQYNITQEDLYGDKEPTITDIVPFLFTLKEERIFLMGRILLVHLRDSLYENDIYSPNLTKIIKMIDDLMYKFNLLLVAKTVHKERRKSEIEDAFQSGTIGLLRAIQKFDIDKGRRFSTYATWWIRQAIQEEENDHGGIIRFPTHVHNTLKKYKRYQAWLEQKHNQTPSFEEVIEEMQNSLSDPISRTRVKNIKRALLIAQTLSLDKSYSQAEDEDWGLLNMRESQGISPERSAMQAEASDRIKALFSEAGLDFREKRVLTLEKGLFGYRRHTLKEIGDAFGLSRERIRQIRNEAIEKIRDKANNQLF